MKTNKKFALLMTTIVFLMLSLSISAYAQDGYENEESTTLESDDESPTGAQDFVDDSDEVSEETDDSDSSDEF